MNKALGLYIAGIIAAALAAAFPSLTWISLMAFLILLPLGAIWIWRVQGRPVGELGFSLSRGWLRYFAIGLLLGLGIPSVFLLIQQVGGWIAFSSRGEPISSLITSLPQVLIRLIFVVAIEEVVFRGFFPNALSQKVGTWTAIVLSSLLWGASHLGSMVNEGLALGEIAIAMATFLAWGITLGLCFLIAKKSLWLPYGIHLGVNLGFSLLGWYFITESMAPQWWVGHPSWSPESGLIGILVWVIIALGTYWVARPIPGYVPAEW
jgi:membrane protease YdiL (CAAX protease family)